MNYHRVELDVYIAGATERSNSAIRNLTSICERLYGSGYEIRVVDVLNDPDAAERQRIVATPTVVRRLPLPSRRVVGDMSDSAAVELHLELVAP